MYSIIWILFLNGLIGSFSHCIGMCGPFAISISNMRLMYLSPDQLTQYNKWKALFATPYYIGKTFSYIFIGTLFYFLKIKLQNIPAAGLIACSVLIATAILFLLFGITQSTSLIKNNNINRFFQKFIPQNQYGKQGLVVGLILGLIPCGLVITSIITATIYSPNLFILIIAIAAFGMATIPGLLIASYCGNIFLNYKKTFKLLFTTLMFYNSYLLAYYALNLL